MAALRLARASIERQGTFQSLCVPEPSREIDQDAAGVLGPCSNRVLGELEKDRCRPMCAPGGDERFRDRDDGRIPRRFQLARARIRRESLVIHASVSLNAPLGEHDPSRIRIGTARHCQSSVGATGCAAELELFGQPGHEYDVVGRRGGRSFKSHGGFIVAAFRRGHLALDEPLIGVRRYERALLDVSIDDTGHGAQRWGRARSDPQQEYRPQTAHSRIIPEGALEGSVVRSMPVDFDAPHL